jgi:hypothetical protein
LKGLKRSYSKYIEKAALRVAHIQRYHSSVVLKLSGGTTEEKRLDRMNNEIKIENSLFQGILAYTYKPPTNLT